MACLFLDGFQRNAGGFGVEATLCGFSKRRFQENTYTYLKGLPGPVLQARRDHESSAPITHDGSMGRTAYLPTFGLRFMVNVGKYTSPMDPVG